ncbi:WxL domain-containing protein [Enterococcus avium]
MTNLKGKVLVGLASVAVLGGVTVGSVGAFADVAGSDSTGVQAKFRGTNEPPVNPGTLQLNSVPTFVGFGTGEVNTPNEAFQAGEGITSHTGELSDPYVKINDERSSSLDPDDPNYDPSTEWKLEASASPLRSTDSSHEISNGNITLNSSGENSVKEWTPGIYPNYTPGQVDDSSSYTDGVTKAESVPLQLDNTSREVAKTNMSARRGYAVKIDSMKLSVDSTQASYAGKTFEGTITWTLSDTI